MLLNRYVDIDSGRVASCCSEIDNAKDAAVAGRIVGEPFALVGGGQDAVDAAYGQRSCLKSLKNQPGFHKPIYALPQALMHYAKLLCSMPSLYASKRVHISLA